MNTKLLADNLKLLSEYVAQADEYKKQAGLLAAGYTLVVTLCRGVSTVYGPKVDAVGVHGFSGGDDLPAADH